MFGALTLASRKGVAAWGLGGRGPGALGCFLIAFSFSRLQWLSACSCSPWATS